MHTFYNPIIDRGADPWVTFKNGYYYYCYSGGNKLYVSKSKNLYDIGKADASLVWNAPKGTMYSSEYWAPELHFINNKWYIYVAADDGNNNNHRMYVLESKTSDPLGSYTFKGKISDSTDKWAIDGTVLKVDSKLYFIWSGWEGDVNVAQNLYIAPMSNPWTISGARVLISTPEYNWEKNGNPLINEGPVALVKNSAVHIVYSASGSWTDDYCLGMLTFKGGDILNKLSWEKSITPVFSKQYQSYGPGHCSFTTSPDGKESWIVYHANLVSGSGWNGRSVRAQKFTWNGDIPVFGVPASPDQEMKIKINK
ncbi:MAG: putative beta-xylosidase [Oscillospiraceae bacterium]|jgi:GH43 family beta-xylosidase|nr:putative beta-xylosidase [Oscillospiraceae bacterium]